MQFAMIEKRNMAWMARKGGGCHEADHSFGIVHPVNGGGLDARVDRCPGAGGVERENCRSALVE
jgi:hypothetical protein